MWPFSLIGQGYERCARLRRYPTSFCRNLRHIPVDLDDNAPKALIADQKVTAIAHDRPGDLLLMTDLHDLLEFPCIRRLQKNIHRSADTECGVFMHGFPDQYPLTVHDLLKRTA